MTFWRFSNMFTLKTIKMNPFSGNTNLWRLLGECEPLKVLYWYCKGPMSWSFGPKIGQICMKFDILGTFGIFFLKKR